MIIKSHYFRLLILTAIFMIFFSTPFEVLALQLFPEKNLVAPPAADPRAPYSHLKLFSFEEEPETNSSLGAEAAFTHNFSTTRWEGDNGAMYQFTCSGGVFSQFQEAPNKSYELVNSDFYFGLPLEMKIGQHGFRAELYHVSSHLGDEFQDRTGKSRISYSHETFRGNYFWYPTPSVRTNFEIQHTISSVPDFDPWLVATGIEYRLGSFLLATDFRFKERSDWDHAATASLFYDLGDEEMYIGLEGFDGLKPEGQFFREEKTYLGIVFRFTE